VNVTPASSAGNDPGRILGRVDFLLDEEEADMRQPATRVNRRGFLVGSLGLVATATLTRQSLAQGGAPAVVTSDPRRPGLPYGAMSGDVTSDRTIIWSRADRPARMVVEWATNEGLHHARRVVGPAALADGDFTARVDLAGLPAGQDIFYRVSFQDLADVKIFSAPALGRFRTAPTARRTVRFCFSGDEAGQGWGINREWGGMKLYEVMRRAQPDFFIHSGDQIYADGPIKGEVTLDDGTVWKNVTTEAKAAVAQTLEQFRGNFAYNLLDDNKRRFAAEVPFLVQWDDHETRNNWFPGQILGDERYSVKSASLLAAFARRAMLDYNPFRLDPRDPERIYRSFTYGPSLEVFMLDERSYRGPNSPNRQTDLDEAAAFLGAEQLRWLKRALLDSRATWKVIASDMPISIVVPDLNPDVPKGTYEAWANADHGRPLGRELEIASLLSFIKNNGITNVVWVTADVHYASATYYDPGRASFSDFNPFWEFVAGPINAGTFGPGEIDRTFGPDVRFQSVAEGMKQNRPPTEGMQYFGLAAIDGDSERLTVTLHDLKGTELFKTVLAPQAGTRG
jgi:alkaline phosphatase D